MKSCLAGYWGIAIEEKKEAQAGKVAGGSNPLQAFSTAGKSFWGTGKDPSKEVWETE